MAVRNKRRYVRAYTVFLPARQAPPACLPGADGLLGRRSTSMSSASMSSRRRSSCSWGTAVVAISVVAIFAGISAVAMSADAGALHRRAPDLSTLVVDIAGYYHQREAFFCKPKSALPARERGLKHQNPNPANPTTIHPRLLMVIEMISLANIYTTTAVLPPRIIIHGREGSGKTTLAAKFPRPIFLQVEDGCPAELEIPTSGVLAKYNDVIAAITTLGNERHEYQTVVIDSLDALEPLVWNAACVENNWKSIESAGYGRGYVEADKQWQDFTAGLDWLRRTCGMIVVLIAHSAVETVNDPRAPSYTSYQLRLHKRGRALMQDWADGIGFLTTELVIQTEDQGFKKRTRADGGSARYVHWEGKPAFTAKNRYALPAKMLVPKDFDYNKDLAPFFPERAVFAQNTSDASVSHGQRNSAGAGAGAGDGADRGDARIETVSETVSEPPIIDRRASAKTT
jgi:hypothetical protein